MKRRSFFVSNSSSSSFIVDKKYLSSKQIEDIHHHIAVGKGLDTDLPVEDGEDWSITETKEFIAGSVDMDNFDMDEFLRLIGVPDEAIDWDDY